MKVDHVLILAAGKGTRMGEIGRIIPKVIWPVFNKSLLGLEVAYAKKLASSAKIYINLFNYSEKIEFHVKKNQKWFEDVTLIKEEDVLDIGGAIHNFAEKINYKGNLLILNSDQFLYCDEKVIEQGLSHLKSFDSVLFSYQVNSSDGYNALDIQNDKLLGIIPNSELEKNDEILTYTGMSLINLSKLKQMKGESKFFNSVANPSENNIKVEKIENFEYWDFGTLPRYYRSIVEISQKKESKFVRFLQDEEALKKIDLNSKLLSFEDFKVGDNKIIYKNKIEENI